MSLLNRNCLSLLVFFLLISFVLPSNIFASEIFSTWNISQNLPYPLASHQSISHDNQALIFGGSVATGNSHNEIVLGVPEIDGEINTWNSSVLGTSPTALIWHSVVTKGNNIYILGGREENEGTVKDSVNKTFRGVINNNTISWSPSSFLPKPLSLGATAIVDNKIYFAGGFAGNLYNNKIYVSNIDNTGELSQWTESGNLPSALIGHGLVEKNGMLYLIGGYTGSTYSKKVYKATPDSNGIISAWQVLEDLPTAVYRGAYGVKDNYIFTIAGGDINGQLDKVYYSSFNLDGTVTPWTTSSFLVPEKMTGSSATIVGDYIYLIGGFSDNTGYLDTVYYSKLSTSTNTNLPVPLLKQTDPVWKNSTYDNAPLWSPANVTIGSWGCAITSAAMVFQYHGINKLPNNDSLNPAAINSWLNSQPDGYVESGWVNWIALSRLSRLAKLSGNNPSFAFDAFEYTRSGFDTTELKDKLSLHLPGILEVPGHFIVAKGTTDTSFLINDPYYSRDKLSDGYNNSYTSLGTFTPSNTDLSYILLTSPNSLSLKLKTSSESAIITSFTQQPISSATPSAKPAGKPFTMLLSPKPLSGNYLIEITGTPKTLYTLQVYLYDSQGEVQKIPITGFIPSNSLNTVSFTYNNTGSSSAKIQRLITFKSTLEDIQIGTNMKLISKEISPSLTQLISNAEILSKKQLTKTQAKQVLKTFEDIINKWKGTPALSETAAKILLEDVLFLKTSF